MTHMKVSSNNINSQALYLFQKNKMIYSSLILSAFYAAFVVSQTTESTTSQSSSEGPSPTDFSSVLENILSASGNATSILSGYSNRISQVLASISESSPSESSPSGNSESSTSGTSESSTTSSPSGTSESSPSESSSTSTSHYGNAYPLPTPAYGSHASTASPTGMPEIMCNISCATATLTKTAEQTAVISKRSQQIKEPGSELENKYDGKSNESIQTPADAPCCESMQAKETEVELEDENDRESNEAILPERPQVGSPDLSCDTRGRPNSPRTPWGWPSNHRGQGAKPFLCYYHAATLPECQVIFQQAVASYCPKSRKPRLCKVKACRVLDQCKRIVTGGRGYCWNPKWFLG